MPNCGNRLDRLSRSQIHARNSRRVRGRFAADPNQPGTSESSLRRLVQRQYTESQARRRLNVEELVNALFCDASNDDYIPANIEDGPLIEIIKVLLKEHNRLPTRLLVDVAKGVYLASVDQRCLPRINIKRNGRIVKLRSQVFLKLKLPDPDRADTLLSLRRVLGKHHRQHRLNHANVDTAISAITPLLKTYKPETFEYEGYPHAAVETTADHPSVARMEPSQPVFDAAQVNRQIYNSRVSATAENEAEYVLLKTVLGYRNIVLLRVSVIAWHRKISALRDGGLLTSLEKTVIEYAMEENSVRRELIGTKLKELLKCCMEIRRSTGLELLLDLGYSAPGFGG